ncbi:MAG: O-antigen ligase family protein [Rhizobiaceae bacterium]
MSTVSLSHQATISQVETRKNATLVTVGILTVFVLTGLAIINPLVLIGPITLIVLGFVFYLSQKISNPKEFASLALLVFSVFILEAVFRVREFSDKSVDWQVLLKVCSLLALMGLALLRLDQTLPSITKPTRIMWFVFFIWTCFTGLYAPNLAYSIFGAFSLVSFYLFLLYVFRSFEETHVILAIITATFFFCLFSILTYFALPEFGRMKEWYGNEQVVGSRLSGIGGNANTVGRQAALALLLLALYAKNLMALNRLIVPAVVIVASAALLLSNSRTSLALLLIILWFLWFCTEKRKGIFLLSILAGFILLPFVFLYGESILTAFSRSGDISEITTGTGRSYIWAVVIELITQRPLFGWGYGSTLFILPEYAGDIRHIAPHAHNMILQILVTSGLIGLVIFVIAFFIRLFDAYQARNRTVLTMMAFVCLNGLTEASAFAGVANSATLALLIAVAIPLRTSPTSHLRN